MRSLLSLWWSKVWTTLRLETQRVNTFTQAAMGTELEDWNPLIVYQIGGCKTLKTRTN
jgi:hypothetical protein